MYLLTTHIRGFFLGAGLSTGERAASAAAMEQRCRPLYSHIALTVRFRCSWKWITNTDKCILRWILPLLWQYSVSDFGAMEEPARPWLQEC